MKTGFLQISLLAMLAVACTKSGDAEDEVKYLEPDPEDTYEATINFSNGTGYDLGGEEGSVVTVRFAVDHEWYLKPANKTEVTWLEPDKTYGNSSKVVKLKFTAVEENGYETRTAAFRILSGASKKKFTITQNGKTLILNESDVEDLDRYYKPQEFDFDMLRSDSKWSWVRSKQSEHFVVFWDKEYGEYGLYGSQLGIEDTWPTTAKSSKMAVDIDDLLEKAETFYDTNVNKLKFCEVGSGKSTLDKYKMEIYLLYQSEWLATGSGYDNTIGALWVNPSTCQPVGSTIAHEIGHSFQYMVFCDWLMQNGKTGNQVLYADGTQGPGYRYGFGSGGSGGCGFWEQTAQWQSFQTYMSQAFDDYYATEFFNSPNLHILHERPRYANYFIHWWWVEQNDISFIGRLWREAKYPEDPCETYMRLMGYDNEQFNDDMWQYAAHMLTFDTDEIRKYGKNSIGKTATDKVTKDGDWWQISASKAPESTGSNAIRMKLPSAGERTVSVNFEGLGALSGCVTGSVANSGWRYGFVAYCSDGSTVYGDMTATDLAAGMTTASFEVPANASYLWFVVSGAPKTYERHPWNDETDDKDIKWPWHASFSGTSPYGK